jgi:hypothetical protein
MPLALALMLAAASGAAPCSTEYFPLPAGGEWEHRLDVRTTPHSTSLGGTGRTKVVRTSATSVVVSYGFDGLRDGDEAETTASETIYICSAEGPVAARDWTRFGIILNAASETPAGLAPALRWQTWTEIVSPRRVVVKTRHEAKAIETVTVPAGTFPAFRVDFERVDGDEPRFGVRVETRGSRWYARGVGLLRYRAETVTTVRGAVQSRTTTTQELLAYRLPATLTR